MLVFLIHLTSFLVFCGQGEMETLWSTGTIHGLTIDGHATEGDFGDLEDRVEVLEDDMSSNASRISVVETDLGVVETDLASNASRISNNETELASNASRF